MKDIEQLRDSISDASYALRQVGENMPHSTLLVMEERLKRLIELEYALLTDMGETEKTMVQDVEKVRAVDGLIKHVEYAPHPHSEGWLTITKMDDTKWRYRVLCPESEALN